MKLTERNRNMFTLSFRADDSGLTRVNKPNGFFWFKRILLVDLLEIPEQLSYSDIYYVLLKLCTHLYNVLLGSLRKSGRRRQGERHTIKDLITRTLDMHERYKFQFWRTQAPAANFFLVTFETERWLYTFTWRNARRTEQLNHYEIRR